MQPTGLEWFHARTAGSPDRLRGRVEWFMEQTSAGRMVDRLAMAGESALAAAIAAGEARAAALDLLAADALITLALLAQAEERPGDLARTARALRMGTAA